MQQRGISVFVILFFFKATLTFSQVYNKQIQTVTNGGQILKCAALHTGEFVAIAINKPTDLDTTFEMEIICLDRKGELVATKKIVSKHVFILSSIIENGNVGIGLLGYMYTDKLSTNNIADVCLITLDYCLNLQKFYVIKNDIELINQAFGFVSTGNNQFIIDSDLYSSKFAMDHIDCLFSFNSNTGIIEWQTMVPGQAIISLEKDKYTGGVVYGTSYYPYGNVSAVFLAADANGNCMWYCDDFLGKDSNYTHGAKLINGDSKNDYIGVGLQRQQGFQVTYYRFTSKGKILNEYKLDGDVNSGESLSTVLDLYRRNNNRYYSLMKQYIKGSLPLGWERYFYKILLQDSNFKIVKSYNLTDSVNYSDIQGFMVADNNGKYWGVTTYSSNSNWKNYSYRIQRLDSNLQLDKISMLDILAPPLCNKFNDSPIDIESLPPRIIDFQMDSTRSYLGIQNLLEARGISAWPNPVNNGLKIKIDGSGWRQCSIKIISITGTVISSRIFTESDELKLDCSEIPEGLYYLRIKTSASVWTKKIVVTR